MRRLAQLRSRLTYANIVASLALFAALAGASYAAVALPPGSVGTRQLAFPLGLKSRQVRGAGSYVFVCRPGEHCPKEQLHSMLSLNVSLKRQSSLLVLAQTAAEMSPSAGQSPTTLEIGVQSDRHWYAGEQYLLSSSRTTITFYQVVPARVTRTGVNHLRLRVLPFSTGGPRRKVSFLEPQITVIALPGLG